MIRKLCEGLKKIDPIIWIISYVLISAFLLYWYPPVQILHFGINNTTTNATLENQYRATLVQILGGAAAVVGVYFAWQDFIANKEKTAILIAQDNLKMAREGQITERFLKAIDQLGAVDFSGNPALEIRLGGIYALERIACESDKDYWPIMEILTAYVRQKSPIEKSITQKIVPLEQNKLPEDIQAILTVIGRRKYSFDTGENFSLNLQSTFLKNADIYNSDFAGANLKGANLSDANLLYAILSEANLQNAILTEAYLAGAVLKGANLKGANLKGANLSDANLLNAILSEANLQNAILIEAYLVGAVLKGANLKGANLKNAYLEGANLKGANLKGAENSTVEQLCEAKTLYQAQLDEELEAELRARDFGHLLDDDPER